jgi:regulator of sigma E protease
MSSLVTVLATAVVLGVMILVHEFGHFIVAKSLGVRVEQFAIGFGKKIVGFRKGETEYRINVLPIGGYVKMTGENPSESRTGDPGEFTSHPRWHRLLIALAGPFMNIALAIVLLVCVYAVHYEHPWVLNKPAQLGWVIESSPAEHAGLKAGDRIVRVENIQNPTWEQVVTRLALNPGQPVSVAIQRGNDIVESTLTPDKSTAEQFDMSGLVPDQPLIVTDLEPGKPAMNAGVKFGDEITAINGTPVRSMPLASRIVRENKDNPLKLDILRNGQHLALTMVPALTRLPNGQSVYRIGFGSAPVEVDKLPFRQAVAQSIETNKRNSVLILELVQKMVQRKVSMKQLAGPIGIGSAVGQAVRQPGWMPTLDLAALISINLGIFNLLPIPILDGGLILLLLVEGLMRRDISQPVKERIYQAAFVFLLLFGVVVIYNDIMRQLPGVASRLP